MQEIITILIMAMNLLTAVQSNPNLPVEFRTVAISVANNAIVFANQEIAKQPKEENMEIKLPVVNVITLPEITQNIKNNNVGSTIQNMKTLDFKIYQKQALKNAVGNDYLDYQIQVVYRVDGNERKLPYNLAPVMINGPVEWGIRKATLMGYSTINPMNHFRFSADVNGDYDISITIDGIEYKHKITVNEL